MLEDQSIGKMIRNMLLTAAFLAFLIFIAIPSPYPIDDIGGIGGTLLSFFGFIKAFLVGGGPGIAKFRKTKVIPGSQIKLLGK
jgi:hypothetical protein